MHSYLAGPDDIYVSPSQIRRFNLRTGDTSRARSAPPKDGERYFALLKVDTSTSSRRKPKNKVLFENLTPLFPASASSWNADPDGRPRTSPAASST
jgi:transcription termination factor Rho